MENIFKKKESLLAKVFLKLLTPEEVVTIVPEKPYFRTAFGNQAVNGLQTLLKSARHYYYPIFP